MKYQFRYPKPTLCDFSFRVENSYSRHFLCSRRNKESNLPYEGSLSPDTLQSGTPSEVYTRVPKLKWYTYIISHLTFLTYLEVSFRTLGFPLFEKPTTECRCRVLGVPNTKREEKGHFLYPRDKFPTYTLIRYLLTTNQTLNCYPVKKEKDHRVV